MNTLVYTCIQMNTKYTESAEMLNAIDKRRISTFQHGVRSRVNSTRNIVQYAHNKNTEKHRFFGENMV